MSAFIQKLFSTQQNYQNGATRIGERNRIWYDSNTNTFRIQLDSTPGGTVISGGAFGNLDGGLPNSNYGGIASIDAGGID